jgi:hypothetical protein
MKKLLLTPILFLLLMQPVWSYEAKLSCNLHLTSTFSLDGSSEQKNITEILEIYEDEISKIIAVSSKQLFPVSTNKLESTIKIKDQSDKNKWDITNIDKNTKGQISEVSFVIDRNTGKIYYNAKFTSSGGSYINEAASGICVKIDIAKKLF